MMLADINVLIYAHRPEAVDHEEYRAWVNRLTGGDESYAVSDFVINGFVRIVTNRRIYKTPTPTLIALDFVDQVRNQPHATVINPGARHWSIFTRLCREADAKAKLVPDAYLAALAIEHGCEFITADGDFAKFAGLRWRHPLN